MSTTLSSKLQSDVAGRFRSVRQRTMGLCKPLTPEDMMVQSCPEASPAKWHLAHTAWFFESFILNVFQPGYRLFNEDFPWLFNSYYRSFAEFPEKKLRASFSRPGLDEVLRYRSYVDEHLERLLEENPEPEVLSRVELGANHEEQHQELLLTDVLHAFYTNPLRPAYLEEADQVAAGAPGSLRFVKFEGGLVDVGFGGSGFCYDNELPRHRMWLEPYALGNRLVTNREYAEFIADGGYTRSELWLSAGWDAIEQNAWKAPLYWNKDEAGWRIFTLRGEKSLDEVKDPSISILFLDSDTTEELFIAGYSPTVLNGVIVLFNLVLSSKRKSAT